MEDKKFLLGLDVGMMQDYSALSMIEQVETVESADLVERLMEHYEVKYHLVLLERFPLNTQYPAVVQRVKEILINPEVERNNKLIVDSTGIGEGIVQMFREKGVDPVSITITGGTAVTENPGQYEGYHVPKRDLVSAVVRVLQGGRLKIAEGLKLGPVFEEEMQSFSYTLDKKTGHDSYESASTKIHDDLVLSVSLACWYGIKYERHMQEFFQDNYHGDEEINARYNYHTGRLE